MKAKRPTLKEQLVEANNTIEYLNEVVRDLDNIISPPPPPPTHMDNIIETEKCMNEDVNKLVQGCFDKTGRVPTVKIVIQTDESTTQEHKPHVASFCIPEGSYQRDAIKLLTQYCLHNGDWGYGESSKMKLRKWLINSIREAL